MKSEHTGRPEQSIEYVVTLKERFASGLLSELQGLSQWVVWRGEQDRAGKHKKVPYNPAYHNFHASVKNAQSWGTLQEALTALETGNYSGVGLMVTPPLVFIDLDHCFDRATQTITDPKAQDIVEKINSYTEVSPSRTGLHILSFGKLPGRNMHTAIEMYGQDRFTTITTDHVANTPTAIEHRQAALDALYRRFAPPVVQERIQNTRGVAGGKAGLTELPPEAARDPLLQRLLGGDISGFDNDHSRADFVLIMKLLHWTGDNVALTRELFLSSPLGRRAKAKRKTGVTTYVEMTIYNVLKKRRNPPKS